MTIRPASPDDVDAIVALIRELADYEGLAHEVELDPAAVREHLFPRDPTARPAASVLVATDDGAGIVGFALWFPTYSTFLGKPGIWLEDLYVRAEHRGKGHGSALLRHLRTLTDGRVEWAVLDWNTPSIEFYETQIGARPVVGWTRYRWT